MQYTEPSSRLDQLAHRVIGAAIEVHRHLGPGMLESAYQQALMIELELRGIEVRRHVPVPIEYKGRLIGECQLDFLVEEELVIELKSIERFSEAHRAQVVAYLQASRLQLGLLINFNVPLLQQGIRRVIWSAN